jgi:multidrug transporter EmrE-like cation transporter
MKVNYIFDLLIFWRINVLSNGLKYGYIAICILLQSFSGIFGKYAALTTGNLNPLVTITNIFYILSIGCLILQAIFWQRALINYPLSFAYPFMSFVNFVILIASHFLFQESISISNVLGLMLISGGIMMLARSSGASI